MVNYVLQLQTEGKLYYVQSYPGFQKKKDYEYKDLCPSNEANEASHAPMLFSMSLPAQQQTGPVLNHVSYTY